MPKLFILVIFFIILFPGNVLAANHEGSKTTAAGKFCDNNKGIETAIGCVHTEPAALISDIIKLSIAVGGGLALLLMIFGAIGMVTSSGNADALKAAQERFYSAIIGLLFIIFSILLLQIIGVDILKIPGFTK